MAAIRFGLVQFGVALSSKFLFLDLIFIVAITQEKLKRSPLFPSYPKKRSPYCKPFNR
jgi:hypothetical protein